MNLNADPVDQLIRELVSSGRAASEEDVERIIVRMTNAPFDRRVIPVPAGLRGVVYEGRVLGARTDALTYHLVKCVVEERQWPRGTTAEQYVTDLRRAVRHPVARLTIYERRGGFVAAVMTPTSSVIAEPRHATESLPYLLVVYSVDRGILLTGYQVSGVDQTGIPAEARWLR